MTVVGGRVGGCVRLSGWMGKMPCVHAITFGCFSFGCAMPDLIVSSACCCVRSAAGMNMSPVSRLKKTWSKVKTAKFDILEVSLHEKFEIWSRWTNVNTVFCSAALEGKKKTIFFHLKSTLWNVFRIVSLFAFNWRACSVVPTHISSSVTDD